MIAYKIKLVLFLYAVCLLAATKILHKRKENFLLPFNNCKIYFRTKLKQRREAKENIDHRRHQTDLRDRMSRDRKSADVGQSSDRKSSDVGQSRDRKRTDSGQSRDRKRTDSGQPRDRKSADAGSSRDR